MKATELTWMLTARCNDFNQVAPNLHLLLRAVEMCSWMGKYLLNGGESERNGWSRTPITYVSLDSGPHLMGYASNWTIVPLNAKSETRSWTPGLSELASWAERWNFSCLRLKAHCSRWKWKRMRRERESGGRARRKIVDGGKNEEAQEQDRGGRQSKWQLHCK